MKKYLRFKDIPENEISGIYNGDVGKIGEEIGVSCYELNDDYQITMPIDITKDKVDYHKGIYSFLNDLSWMVGDFIDGYITGYIITGDMVGIGSNGEPLLKNISIIKKLEPKEIIKKNVDNSVVVGTTHCALDDCTEQEVDEMAISYLKKTYFGYKDYTKNVKLNEIFDLIENL